MIENKEQLTREISGLVENALIEPILDITNEYWNIMPREEIMKEFFMQCSRVIGELNYELEQQEKEEEY